MDHGMKIVPARTVSLVILISLVTASLHKTKCEPGSMIEGKTTLKIITIKIIT